MDAFPDYTKFNKTEKVFADIQVITEAVEDKEDSRIACRPITIVKAVDPDITLTYDNDGTEENFKVTANGSEIVGNGDNAVRSDEFVDLFNSDKQVTNANVTEMLIELPTTFDVSKKYRVVQINPALALYSNDNRVDVDTLTKKQVFDGGVLAGETLAVLLAERGLVSQEQPDGITKNITVKSGPVVVKIFEVDENDKDVVLVQTVRITNKILFKHDKE